MTTQTTIAFERMLYQLEFTVRNDLKALEADPAEVLRSASSTEDYMRSTARVKAYRDMLKWVHAQPVTYDRAVDAAMSVMSLSVRKGYAGSEVRNQTRDWEIEASNELMIAVLTYCKTEDFSKED